MNKEKFIELLEETTENLKKYISFSEKECNFPSIFDWNWHMELANDIETLLTAYEKEKEKNKSLEQENSFLKMMYRGTDEFKAIENLKKEE